MSVRFILLLAGGACCIVAGLRVLATGAIDLFELGVGLAILSFIAS